MTCLEATSSSKKSVGKIALAKILVADLWGRGGVPQPCLSAGVCKEAKGVCAWGAGRGGTLSCHLAWHCTEAPTTDPGTPRL